MKRVAVVSSNLREVGYDPASSTLEVQFIDGRVYQYFDVPERVYRELLAASSVGQFFHREIRGEYRYARV